MSFCQYFVINHFFCIFFMFLLNASESKVCLKENFIFNKAGQDQISIWPKWHTKKKWAKICRVICATISLLVSII